MLGDLLGNFQTAAAFQVRGNVRRPERVAADFGFYASVEFTSISKRVIFGTVCEGP